MTGAVRTRTRTNLAAANESSGTDRAVILNADGVDIANNDECTTADVDLVLSGEDHRISTARLVHRTAVALDGRDPSGPPRGEYHDVITRPDGTRSHSTRVSPKGLVGANHVLHGKSEVDEVLMTPDIYVL